jgi:hypothetical protein
MTIINPDTHQSRVEILSNLARNVGRRMDVLMEPYETIAIKDDSGRVHWMYIFDEHENRVYRVENGQQQLRDITIGDDGLIDLNDIEQQLKQALTELG